jgi:hypothetical protein
MKGINKKAQIMTFVAIGIFVIVMASLALVLSREITSLGKIEQEFIEDPEVSRIKVYVEECIQYTAERGILENARKGGYYYLPEQSSQGLIRNLPYYKYEGQELLPSNQTLADEIGIYVDNILTLCLDDFQSLESEYNITYEKPKSDVGIFDNKFVIKTDIPVVLSKGSKSYTISEFVTEVQAKQYFDYIKLAKEIISTIEGDEICLTC